MANRRALVKRRTAVRNTRKITRTMQLIATARFQTAFKRAVASKPYTEKLEEIVGNLAGAAGDLDHPLMRVPDSPTESTLLVLTSNRGLCGGYNGNVLRKAGEHYEQDKASGVTTDLRVVGKKGVGYLQFHGWPMSESITDLDDIPTFEQVEPIANSLMDRFVRGETGSVFVVYMKFISTGKQIPVVEQILPLEAGEAGELDEGTRRSEVEFEFSPEPAELLAELLPASVRIRIFQAFTDAAVSEQVARMVAMTAATDAADDMIKRLTQQYNRARQTAITMELLDIVGGANALA
jgi:F-type H+-transporting ATPase subunit gamma